MKDNQIKIISMKVLLGCIFHISMIIALFYTRDNIQIRWKMVMEDKLTLMEIFMLVNIKTINLKAMEILFISMVQSTMANLKMIWNKEKGNLYIEMAIFMKEIGQMIKRKASEILQICLMVIMWENLLIINLKE